MRTFSTNIQVGQALQGFAGGQNLVRPRQETDTTRQLSCDVVFGSPSADCRGTGVCRITARSASSPGHETQAKNCKSTIGLLFPIEGGNGVTMVLTRALLCARIYKMQLRKGKLVLPEPCPLPKHISQTLGLKFKALPAGEYPIQSSVNFLRIDFSGLKHT